MKYWCLLFLILLFTNCNHRRKVNTSFYYWKTIYQDNQTADNYLRHFHTSNLYVRVMDIGLDDQGNPVPISPIVFKNAIPDSVNIVPVVFIINDVLKNISRAQMMVLAGHISDFVTAKVKQAGKPNYRELQIDCDWTAGTRENYFYLLKLLKLQKGLQQKMLSVTIRLHQIKNQKAAGIPPVNAGMLMCYNMGNLRKYGTQNSIVQLSELKKYLGQNINTYPLPLSIGLPLFSWAVVFRDSAYIGISKKIKIADLNQKNQFNFKRYYIFQAKIDLPEFGLNKGDEIRWEAVSATDLQAIASYISPYLQADPLNIIYYHLDETLLKGYPYASLEKVNDFLR